MKRGVDVIVGSLPPPDKLRRGGGKPGGAAEDAADGGADDAEENDDGKDYNPAEDSAAAFAKAIGAPDDVDPAKVLDAFRDLLKNAEAGE